MRKGRSDNLPSWQLRIGRGVKYKGLWELGGSRREQADERAGGQKNSCTQGSPGTDRREAQLYFTLRETLSSLP